MQNDIPPRTKYRIHLLFEELLQQQLLPVLDETPVRVTVAYSAESGQVEFAASYGGKPYDPSGDAENELSTDVLRSMVDDLQYEYDPEAEYGNTLRAFYTENGAR